MNGFQMWRHLFVDEPKICISDAFKDDLRPTIDVWCSGDDPLRAAATKPDAARQTEGSRRSTINGRQGVSETASGRVPIIIQIYLGTLTAGGPVHHNNRLKYIPHIVLQRMICCRIPPQNSYMKTPATSDVVAEGVLTWSNRNASHVPNGTHVLWINNYTYPHRDQSYNLPKNVNGAYHLTTWATAVLFYIASKLLNAYLGRLHHCYTRLKQI